MRHAKYILAFVWLILPMVSCNYNRLDEPRSEEVGQQQWAATTHTIAQLKALYHRGPTQITDNVIIEAQVMSDDNEGNLYRSIYLADATGAIELRLGLGGLSTLFPQGSIVRLHAKGLTLGRYGGQINLGASSKNPRYETAYVAEKTIKNYITYKSAGQVEPINLELSKLSQQYAGKLIKLSDVQFVASEVGQTYADPLNKATQMNVNRTLVDRSGKTIIVRTSSYARFAGRQLPKGSGSITAILTYFNTTPQLLLLKERDAALNGARF